MKRSVLFFMLSCFLLASAAQAEGSLFFTDEETQRIEEEIRKNPFNDIRLSKHLVHLGSILYFAPDRWTLWLQGQKWGPGTQTETVRIIDVLPDSVQLSILMPDTNERRTVTLKAHQSFNLLSGDVIEGY